MQYKKVELKPMQLDGSLGDPFLGQEVRDLETLIALKLKDLTHFVVIDESAIACEFLGSGQSERLLNNGRESSVLSPF